MLSVPRSRRSSADDAQAAERRLAVLDCKAGPSPDEQALAGPEKPRRPVPGHRIRLDPGRPGAAALCLVAVLSAVIAAGLTWASRPELEPVAAAPVVTAGSAALAAPAATAAPSPAAVVVAVVGQVVTPGLVTLPAGSRVADAVAAAGGALPAADLSTVNLARILVDGEQVAVGVPGAPPAPGAPEGLGSTAPLNLNTASAAELEELPGVGPVLAGRIVQWRTDNGGFGSVEQLQDVDGIGPSTFEELRDQVTV